MLVAISILCAWTRVLVCIVLPLLSYRIVAVILTFPRKEGAEEDRLVIYSSSEFKRAEEGGCTESQEISQV